MTGSQIDRHAASASRYCQHLKLCKGQNSELGGSVSSLMLSSALRCASTCVNYRQPASQPTSSNSISAASASCYA